MPTADNESGGPARFTANSEESRCDDFFGGECDEREFDEIRQEAYADFME